MPICHGADELAGQYQFEDWSFALVVFLGFVSCIGDLGFITECVEFGVEIEFYGRDGWCLDFFIPEVI